MDKIDLTNSKDYYSYEDINELFRAYGRRRDIETEEQKKIIRKIGYIIKNKFADDFTKIQEYYDIAKNMQPQLEKFFNILNGIKDRRNQNDLIKLFAMLERDKDGLYKYIFTESEKTATPYIDNTLELYTSMTHPPVPLLKAGNNMKKKLLKKYI